MKLAGKDAARYFRRPDPARAGLLIHGADAMRVAIKRQEAIAAMIGPDGEAEMRLTRMSGADLRRDGALLLDAVKAQGFFPGPRVAFVEEATDAAASAIVAALDAWAPGDAQIVVTANLLKPASTIRKAFEAHRNAYAVAIYDDPPSAEEIEDALRRAGFALISPEASADLGALARALDPGDFRQMLEKLSIYKFGDDTALGSADVAACAPATIEAEVDEILHIVAEARLGDIAPVMQRLSGQGVNPVTLCIGATRHFRTLHAAAADPSGAQRVWNAVRNFKLRERMQAQARNWPVHKLEAALRMLMDADLTLRSSSRAPAMAVMERTLIRLAMLGRAR
jgi:DNA polymerase III subunit delta